MHTEAQDLLRFIDASPTPYHAVVEAIDRLEEGGYSLLGEAEAWSLEPGARHVVVRADGSLVAFEIGTAPLAEAGARILGAHTDSPNLRIKPNPERVAAGQRTWAAEPYGGVLLPTWFDRDLGLAGRVVLRDDAGELASRLVRLDRESAGFSMRVPNLAIHLQRDIRTSGFKPNPQDHMIPLVGLESMPPLMELLCEAVESAHGRSITPDAILGFDLMAFDLQPSALGGHEDAYVFAPRLDNLASCHAGVRALLAATASGPSAHTRMIALWDHEEVGSHSVGGAAGSLLGDVMLRLAGSPEADARARASSFMVSADMAHALHPNYQLLSEPAHAPVLGAGPVIKLNPNQRYATDAATSAWFRALCDEVDVPSQHFVNRADLGCGSTIGPLASTALGVRTVDVGGPMLSMHSVREMAASADVEPMIRVLTHLFTGAQTPS